MSLDFKKIKDMTGEAVKDINDKKIRTCLTPDLTFKYNTKRIIRVIYLACKLGFDIEPSIIDWIRSNPHYLREVSANYISKNIESSMIYDPDRTAYLINEMRLWKYITISESLLPYYMKHTL
jgi:tRNA nucleotidyltransferase/poly(A) polymerase